MVTTTRAAQPASCLAERPAASAEPVAAGTELRRGALGVGLIVLLVISAASPLSVVAGGFPLGMLMGNGAGTPALVLVALALLLIFAAGYTAMAGHVTNAGGFYAFVARGLGGQAGGAAAWLALLGYNALQFGLYGMFGTVTADALAAQFGLVVPWWVCALVAMVSVAFIGYRQIDFSARVLACFVVAEYAAVMVLNVAILRAGGAQGIELSSFTPEVVMGGNPGLGLLFCFAAFIGFEATTIYAEEARDPKRSIPLATYIAVLSIGGFYAFSLWCMVQGVGAGQVTTVIGALKDPTTLLYALSDHYVGPWLTSVLRVLFIMSVYAGLIAFHNSIARYFYALGREGLLPATLGTTHPQHQSPHHGSLLQSALTAVVVTLFVVAQADPILVLFAWLSNLASLCVLVLMALTAVAILAFYRHRSLDSAGPWRTQWAPLVAAVGLTIVTVLAVANFPVLTGANRLTAFGLIGLLPVAAVVGVLAARRLKRASPARYATLGRNPRG